MKKLEIKLSGKHPPAVSKYLILIPIIITVTTLRLFFAVNQLLI